MAYYQIEPFGERAAFFRSGLIAATIANANRNPKRPAFKVSDFMPDPMLPKQPPKVQTLEEQKRALLEMFERAKRAGLTKEREVKDGGSRDSSRGRRGDEPRNPRRLPRR